MSLPASDLEAEGHPADAEKMYREALAIQLRTLGPDHPDTLISKFELADVLFEEGHVREAETLQRETLATQLRVLGPENPRTWASESKLARTLLREGHYAEAERLARDAFERDIRTLGPQNYRTRYAMLYLGQALAYEHRYPEASKLFRDTIDKQGNAAGQRNPWWAWYEFACVAEAANRHDEALRYLQEAIHLGYKTADYMMTDDDLKNLRSNPKFQQLVAELKRPPTKVQPQ